FLLLSLQVLDWPRPISPIRSLSALITPPVVPVEDNARRPAKAVVIPAPRSFPGVTILSYPIKRTAAADVVAAVTAGVRGPGVPCGAMRVAGACERVIW